MPGSGDKLPAELRLVLGGYAGIACGLFAGALACAAAVVVVIFDAEYVCRLLTILRRRRCGRVVRLGRPALVWAVRGLGLGL